MISCLMILNCFAEICSTTLGVISTVDSRSSKMDFSNLKFGSTLTLAGNECDKAMKNSLRSNLVIIEIRVI